MATYNLDLDDFLKMMDHEADVGLPQFMVDVQMSLTYKLYEYIVVTTPVLTGKARRNWVVSQNYPSTAKVNDVAGVALTGSPMTMEESSRVLEAVSKLQFGQSMYITNNQDYVVGLDNGTSQKAPGGIVDVSVHGALEYSRLTPVIFALK